MLFAGDHPRLCATCRHAGPSPGDAEALLCRGKKPVTPEHSCSRYRYDPLKRQPPPPPELSGSYTPEDFSL